MSEIWLVDDDIKILNKLDSILTKSDYKITAFCRPEEILDKLKYNQPAVIIIDLFFNNSNLTGEDVVKKISDHYPTTQSIIMSGETDIKKTLSCLKLGALDFLEKPVSLARLLTSVKNAEIICSSRVSAENQFNILGNSNIIKETIKKLRKLANLKENVLIYGESGTGKEMAAGNLHVFSDRYSKPMSTVNCTALNSNLIESELFGHKKGSFTGAVDDKVGYFEKAHKSSLFIDEIGDFPLELQAKLLRVLQENRITPVGDSHEIEIDTRLIFATHKNLNDLIKENKFREDFYFRISTFSVTMPSLRERIEDVEILSKHFLEKFLSENSLGYKYFSSEAISKLMEYNYPGNIRELIQIVKNSAYFSDGEKITPEDINFANKGNSLNIWDITKKMDLTQAKRYFEKELLTRRLNSMSNHIENTAESLGMVKNNLYRKLKTHGIEK